MIRVAILAIALTLPGTAAIAAADGLDGFRKGVMGRWSKLPIPALSDFNDVVIAAALARCASVDPGVLTYAEREGRLWRGEADSSAIVLDAKGGTSRRGFRQWLVLRSDGGKVLLLGEAEAGGTKHAIMMSDEASYVRCPSEEKQAD